MGSGVNDAIWPVLGRKPVLHSSLKTLCLILLFIPFSNAEEVHLKDRCSSQANVSLEIKQRTWQHAASPVIILMILKLKSSCVKCISERLYKKCLPHLRWCHWLKSQDLKVGVQVKEMQNSCVTGSDIRVPVCLLWKYHCESEFSHKWGPTYC